MAEGLRSLVDAGLREAIGNRSTAKSGLAEGTNAGTIKTTNTTPFLIGGAFLSKNATDNIAWGTAATTGVELADLPDLKTGYYTVSLNSAGAVKVNGYIAGDDVTAIIIKAPVADTAVIGVIKVVNASGAVFNPGTTDLSAAGITATCTDYAVLPVTETI